MNRLLVTVLAMVMLTGFSTLHAQTLNGFDLSGSLLPVDEILRGGPPRDGIPALTAPKFEAVRDVKWLDDDDRLLVVERNGRAKAYPIRILTWHEVVNDEVGGEPIAVTYCPLCGTGMAFDLRVDGRTLELGVSGLLYNSDVLMYDRQTESLWSQLQRRAVTGPLKGLQMVQLPLVHTTWGRWKHENPDGLVLSRDTEFPRNYDQDPYLTYAVTPRTMFPVNHRDDRLPTKTTVFGVTEGDAAVAFALDDLVDQPRPVRARVGERELFVYYFPDTATLFLTTTTGEPVAGTMAYWFAWSAFYPETELWQPAEQ